MSLDLHIRFFGTFVLRYQGETLRFSHSERLQALLAYLVLHPTTPHARQHLAFLFWPESTDSQARSNLRKLLFQLRKALPQADIFLHDDEHTVQWKAASPYTTDVIEIDTLLSLSSQRLLTREENVRLLELVQGDLLPSCYDDWIVPLRQKYQRQVRQSLEQLVTQLENLRAYEDGIHYAQILLDLDPLEERSYQQMMRLRLLRGDQAGAVRTYQACLAILQRELGVEPSPTLRQVYEQMLRQPLTPEALASAQPSDTATLVARVEEWEQLQKSWQRAQQGRAQVVMLAGEAGIGKTRLAEELLLWASRQGILTARTRSYAAQGALAYTPMIELLRTPALHSRLAKLKPMWLVELARLLPEVMELSPNLPTPEPLTDRWQRQRLYEALAQAIGVDQQPILLFIDDLQWCDQESLEWLQYLLTSQRSLRLLVVGGIRTGEVNPDHPLHALRHALYRDDCLTECALAPLMLDEASALAEQVVGNALTDEQLTGLYQASEGNPLFVVEMARAMQEGKLQLLRSPTAEPLSQGASGSLPPRVASVIEARLGQLSTQVRDLVGVAAAIGHSFSFPVLLQASKLTDERLVDALDELCRRQIVKEQAGDLYDFSHDRIRDVAYRQQSLTRRRLLHRRILEVLPQHYAGRVEVIVGELAFHAEQAGEVAQAITYLQQAAQVAQSVAAYPEVVTRLRKALALLQTLPLLPEAAMRQELAILVTLGASLVAMRGYGDIDVEGTYKRAHELCTRLGDDPNLMPILIGLSLFYLVRGELHQALAIARQSLRMARRIQNDELLLESHHTVGAILQYLGKFRASVIHLRKAIALYDPVRHSGHADAYGQDPCVVSQVLLSISLWMLGYVDSSVRPMQEGLALAHNLGHRYSLCFAQSFVAHLHQLRQEVAESLAAASIAQEYADQHGFRYWQAITTMFRTWAIARLDAAAEPPVDQRPEKLAPMLDAFSGFKQTGAGLYRAFYLGLIIEGQIAVGDLDAAMSAVNEAHAIVEKAEDRFWVAEIHRLRGEIFLCHVKGTHASGEAEIEAERAFLQAVQVAHTQEARALELRAATSLASLWIRQGQCEKVHQLLNPLVEWFKEGWDTLDLQNAKALLATLE